MYLQKVLTSGRRGMEVKKTVNCLYETSEIQDYQIKIYLKQEKHKREEVLKRAYKVDLHSFFSFGVKKGKF